MSTDRAWQRRVDLANLPGEQDSSKAKYTSPGVVPSVDPTIRFVRRRRLHREDVGLRLSKAL
jgi:hypothetical protein